MSTRSCETEVTQQDVFPLAELPAELRVMVFKAALTMPGGIVFTELEPSGPIKLRHEAQVRSCLAVLSMCRQIREENLRLFYAENPIHLLCDPFEGWPLDGQEWGGRSVRNIREWLHGLEPSVRRLWRLSIWDLDLSVGVFPTDNWGTPPESSRMYRRLSWYGQIYHETGIDLKVHFDTFIGCGPLSRGAYVMRASLTYGALDWVAFTKRLNNGFSKLIRSVAPHNKFLIENIRKEVLDERRVIDCMREAAENPAVPSGYDDYVL